MNCEHRFVNAFFSDYIYGMMCSDCTEIIDSDELAIKMTGEHSMKFKHVRDILRGKDKRVEELEDALQHIILACEASDNGCRTEMVDLKSAIEIIEEKARKTLDK